MSGVRVKEHEQLRVMDSWNFNAIQCNKVKSVPPCPVTVPLSAYKALVVEEDKAVHLVIRFTQLLCNSTHPMTVYEKCHIERGHDITTITIRQKLLQPIYRVQLSKSLNRIWYTFNNVDACAFVLRRRNPVLRLLFANFQKFSNINHSCPFTDYLIVDRFAISDIQVARLPILAGEYALLTAWQLNGVDAAYTNVFVIYS
ncbi:PREDICTED: uncharacterized protein LOC108974863 [Bactrocera latifrons]|uniref:uncharacterized protein LOC108974863 n=1 Tax=Bactrocera latifrons TaxID=174628 RepID=UPI0008DD6FA2|nr:PREDICTED: uncharacterized protein LOC108974863 [Bactrocera latifrons]